MMLPVPLLEPLKSVLVYNKRKIYIDNVFFRLHYTWTVMILLAFAIIITSKLYIGDPIDCLASPDVKQIANQYCFIHSTFTRGKLEKGRWVYEPVSELEIHPGVRPGTKGETATYHTYYQWVWIVLVIQAIGFYYPHWAWEKLERGYTQMLTGDLNLPMLSEEKQAKQRRKVLRYFRKNRGYHLKYAIQHIVCEFINLANVILQVYLIDYFINFEFSKYGLGLFELTSMRPYLRDDSIARVFPTVTACRIATGGVAFGRVQHDVLCVLPINIINEKCYVFLWFWLIFVILGSIVGIIYRVLTLIPIVRKWLLQYRVRYRSAKKAAEKLTAHCQYGDWFLIYKLGQNINPISFGDLITELEKYWKDFEDVERGEDPDEHLLMAPTAPHPSPQMEFPLDTPRKESKQS